METALRYYAQQSSMTDPRQHAQRFEQLPPAIPELVDLVQNLTVHVFWAERYGLKVLPERAGELQLRTIERRLARTLELDSRALSARRSPEAKLLGNCRDHSVLLASLLRHQAIPARARCGFGAYFAPNHFEDHWVTEYWDAARARWVLVDAQLDALQREVLGIDFDPLDVPRDQFLVAGKAWQLCRAGEQDPDAFGIFEMHGLGFVRGNLVRDLAALNAMEMLPWDCWGVILREGIDDAEDLRALDAVAALTAGDVPEYLSVRKHYVADPRFRIDGEVLSYVDGAMIPVSVIGA